MRATNKSRARKSRHVSVMILLLLDVLCIAGSYVGLLSYRYNQAFLEHYNPVALAMMLLTSLFTVYLVNGYQPRRDSIDARYYSEYLLACIINFLGALVIIYFLTDTPASRASVGTTLLLFPVLSVWYRRAIFKLSRREMEKRVMLVVGVSEPAQEFYELLRKKDWPHDCHFFDPTGNRAGEHLVADDTASPIIRSDVLKEISDARHAIETIVLAARPDEIPSSLVEWLVSRHYLELHVQTLDNFYTSHWKVEPLNRISSYWAFEDGFLLNQSFSFERGKRLFDVALSSLGLVLTLPLWVLIIIAIKLESRGPAFFRQGRIGVGQNPFQIYKFRSMCQGADKGDVYTRSNDPRVTRIGAFLRKTRLDELPQLLNVLKGDMSIIGPRPEWDKLVDKYQRAIPYYHFRHLVKPGITGWAQVNYPYGENEQDAIEKLKYDLYYVRYYSFLLDLTICFKTAYIIFFGKGR